MLLEYLGGQAVGRDAMDFAYVESRCVALADNFSFWARLLSAGAFPAARANS